MGDERSEEMNKGMSSITNHIHQRRGELARRGECWNAESANLRSEQLQDYTRVPSGHHLHLHLHRIAQSASPSAPPRDPSFIFIRGPFILIHLCVVSLCRSHLLIKRASRKGGCLIKEGGSDCYHFLRCCVSLLFFKAHTRFQREP